MAWMMADCARLTDVATVTDEGAWVGTVETAHGDRDEIIVIHCRSPADPPVRAYINRCTHEDQRLYREPVGIISRDGEVVCPRHGSHFDACTGDCDNGEAAGTTLVTVDIEVDEGVVYLMDDDLTFLTDGPIDTDDGPASTSHLGL